MGRPTRGSRLHEFYSELDSSSMRAIDGQIPSSLDSAFQLQEYISALVRADPHNVERIVKLPSKDERDRERDDLEVDEACWIYEQLRRLALDLTYPLVDMLQNTCNRRTCPEMKAGEWLYLCVAHGSSGAMEQCCAIDYIVHTIDSATALLNSPRAFPSRLSIPVSSRRHFPSLARRLGRIFAHAYFHHREGFAAAEAQNSLYARFLALCKRFDLVPPEFLVIPLPQDEHSENARSSVVENGHDRQLPQSVSVSPDAPNITILSRSSDDANASSNYANANSYSPSSSTSQSRSPRNRLRTDTMYLSGTFHEVNSGFAGANAGGGGDIETRRVSSPLAATLASQEEEDEKAALAQSIALSSSAGPDGTITDINDTHPEQATLVTPPSVPIITSNAPPQILIRDFALQGSFAPEPIPEPTTAVVTAIPDAMPGLDPDVVTTTTMSVPSTTHMVIPPIVVNAPEVGDDIVSSPFSHEPDHAHVITEVSAEDEDEENPDVDDLEQALENDDDEEEEEEEGEEEGNNNVGMELPESDIASASAIEVRFEEIAPEPEQEPEQEQEQEQEQEEEVELEHKQEEVKLEHKQEEVKPEHEQEEEDEPKRKQEEEEVEPEHKQEEEVGSEHANKLDTSSSMSALEDASTEHPSESAPDEPQTSQDKATATLYDKTSDPIVDVDTDTTIPNRDSEDDTPAESFEASSAAEPPADVEPKVNVEGSEQLDAEPVSNASFTSPETIQSQSASTDGSASTTERLTTESLSAATTTSSDDTLSNSDPPTNGEEKVEKEPEASSPVDLSSSETKASEN